MILIDLEYLLLQAFGSDKEDLSATQMMIRVLVIFLIALILLRFAGSRSFGSKSAFDIVLSITLGAVLSRGITGHYSYLACIAAAAVLSMMHRLVAILCSYNASFSHF